MPPVAVLTPIFTSREGLGTEDGLVVPTNWLKLNAPMVPFHKETPPEEDTILVEQVAGVQAPPYATAPLPSIVMMLPALSDSMNAGVVTANAAGANSGNRTALSSADGYVKTNFLITFNERYDGTVRPIGQFPDHLVSDLFLTAGLAINPNGVLF